MSNEVREVLTELLRLYDHDVIDGSKVWERAREVLSRDVGESARVQIPDWMRRYDVTVGPYDAVLTEEERAEVKERVKVAYEFFEVGYAAGRAERKSRSRSTDTSTDRGGVK